MSVSRTVRGAIALMILLGCIIILPSAKAARGVDIRQADPRNGSISPSITSSTRTTTINLPSNSAFFDTGMAVSRGDSIHITATGEAFNGCCVVTPDGAKDRPPAPGYGDAILLSVSNNSIVGTIGNSFSGEALLDDGQDLGPAGISGTSVGYPGLYGPGFVGSSFTGVAKVPGNIVLGFNDTPLNDNTGSFSVVITVSPSKIPVVLIHGLNDTYLGWDAYKTAAFLPSIGLTAADIWPIASLETGGGKKILKQIGWTTATIDENARRLSDYIAMVKQQTHMPKVDIVAHSMGGLIARRYISHYMNAQSPDVSQLIMLGTPNMGSTTAEIAIILLAVSPLRPLAVVGWNYPAILELTPTYLAGWNINNLERHGVPFYAVAGNMNTCLVGNPLESKPNDIIVSRESAFAIPLNGAWTFPSNILGGCSGIHTGMRSQNSTLFGGGPEIFNQYVKPLLQGSSPTATTQKLNVSSVNTSTILDNTEAMQVGRVLTATLQPNQRLELPQTVVSTTQAIFTVMGSSNQMIVSLREPNGQVITPTTTESTISYLQMDENLFPMTTYAITNPALGTWTTVIEPNSETPSTGINIATTVIISSDLRLTIPVSADTLRVNNPVKLTARMQANSAAVLGANLRANFLDPNGISSSINLHDDGQQGDVMANDGVYTYEFTPTTRGVYGGAITASGIYNEQSFDRSAAWAIPIEGEMIFLPNIHQ